MKTLDIIQGFCDHVFRDKKGNRIFPTSKKEIFIWMGIFAFQPELGHERFPVTSDKVCFIIRYFPFRIQHLLSYKQISVMKIVLIQCPVSANEIS